MKATIYIIFAIISYTAFAHTQEECVRYASEIVDMMLIAPEWDDCIDEESTDEEIEVLYPTMDSAFESGMPSNSCAYGWTVSERRQAFDDFIQSISSTNRTIASKEYLNVGAYALLCSTEKGYTNIMPQVKAIISSHCAPCKDSALTYLLRLEEPSDELTDIIIGVQSNKTDFTMHDRRRAMGNYVRSLCSVAADMPSVVSNAAVRFYANRAVVDQMRALDMLLLNTYPNYAISSNRFDIASTAINQIPDDSTEFFDIKLKEYFTAVTNSIIKSSQPQCEISALRGI